MVEHLDSYKDLLGRTIERDGHAGTNAAVPGTETEFRRHGAAMVSVALQVANKERNAVQGTLKLLKRLPVVFVVLLLVLTIYMVHFLTRQMLGPLSRLMRTTQRISQGDFTPHRAVRRFKDEFTNLAMALNRMRRELLRRQEILVESQRLRSLGTLTAGVAHELNNPLSNISSSTQILFEEVADQLSEYHRELLVAIESQIVKARDIVRALLEFSRERDFVLKPTDLRMVVEDTLKLIKGEVPKDVEIQVDVPEGIELDLDKSRIQQAFLNLISNSIHAMQGQAGGRLTIRGRAKPEADEFILEVADTGTGIPPEQLTYIFDPFFTTKDVGHGTGLGLSVTYGIVERHGGRISVQSELGKGTRFEIVFPLR
jgi:two-component system NtrC family sensor kinase